MQLVALHHPIATCLVAKIHAEYTGPYSLLTSIHSTLANMLHFSFLQLHVHPQICKLTCDSVKELYSLLM